MIKRILVPTDGSDSSAVGEHYAIALAKKHRATLLGLHVIDIKFLEGPILRDISASLGTAPYVNYQGNISLILGERGKTALESFEKKCRQAGVECETTQTTGIVIKNIIEKSELADLVVMGAGGEHTEWLDGLIGSTTEAVARRAKRPILVTRTDTPGSKKFVIAYDASQHAREALQIAADIGVEWGAELDVLVIGRRDKTQRRVAEAKAYLDAHELQNVSYIEKEDDPSEGIVAYVTESSADLLVMGAYGHTKVRELVVGSTTSYALNHSPCPTLLVR